MSEPSTREAEQVDMTLDLRERGAAVDGQPQVSERRLFMQLFVYTGCRDPEAAKRALEAGGLEAVVYVDLNDPQGIGVLLMTESPEELATSTRMVLAGEPFASWRLRPELTMIGRTYSMGHERDLEDSLLKKPRRSVRSPQWSWAIWYPLRRRPEFALLSKAEQGKILVEHATMGMAFGKAGLATDIRLACYGLDLNDNEFVIGLVGSKLTPLSRLIQEMRKSQQTAKYIQSLGPFFVGRVYWQRPL